MACFAGTIACDDDEPICTATSPLADGTTCGTDMVCNDGACLPCAAGRACVADDECVEGLIACDTGGPLCLATTTAVEDGTPCSLGSCRGGACAIERTIEIPSAGSRSAWPLRSLPPLVVTVLDVNQAPVVDAPVSIAGPPGLRILPADARTDANGRVTFDIRLGRQLGTFALTVETPHAPAVEVPYTASAPPAGTLLSLVNEAFDTTNFSVLYPGYGPESRTSISSSLAAASDGSIYVDNFSQIARVSPAGWLSRFAGDRNATSDGDGGPAIDARIGLLAALALDEVRGRLYLLEQYERRVRVIDLASGTIAPLAGGGSAPSPGRGAGGPATSANLLEPVALSVGPDGGLFIADRDRIWRVDPGTGVIDVWYAFPTSCTDTTLALIDCGPAKDGCVPVFDPQGRAYVPGTLCGTSLGPGTRTGIVRFDPDGSLHHHAGKPSGPTADGTPAAELGFGTSIRIAIDPAGNLFVSDYSRDMIRRIDASTATATLVAGRGVSGNGGDGGPATAAYLDGPTELAVQGGNLLFVDTGNDALRMVQGVAATQP